MTAEAGGNVQSRDSEARTGDGGPPENVKREINNNSRQKEICYISISSFIIA